MKITIEIDERSELEKLTAFFKAFNIDKVSMVKTDAETKNTITKGDKSIDPDNNAHVVWHIIIVVVFANSL